MSGYICRFYDEDVKILKMIDEDVKILKMIYIKTIRKKYERKIMENDTDGVIR